MQLKYLYNIFWHIDVPYIFWLQSQKLRTNPETHYTCSISSLNSLNK